MKVIEPEWNLPLLHLPMRFARISILALLIIRCADPVPEQQKRDSVIDSPHSVLSVRPDTVSRVYQDSISRDSVGELEQQLIDAGLVNIQKLDSTIHVQLRYSGTYNFLGMDVYGSLEHCYLQADVAEKLVNAQQKLRSQHPDYALLIYDGVRPLHIQQLMWDTIDVPLAERTKYLSNPDPKKGSLHNYGAAVDLTICTNDGKPLDMGTDFDYFGELAYPSKEQMMLDSGKVTRQQISNRKLLRSVMYSSGFFGIQTEWWHFNSITRDSASKIYRIIE